MLPPAVLPTPALYADEDSTPVSLGLYNSKSARVNIVVDPQR